MAVAAVFTRITSGIYLLKTPSLLFFLYRLDLLTRWQTEKMSAHVIMSFGIVFYKKRRISVLQSKYLAN